MTLHRKHNDQTVVSVIDVHRTNWLAQALVEDDPASIPPKRVRLYFEDGHIDFWLAPEQGTDAQEVRQIDGSVTPRPEDRQGP